MASTSKFDPASGRTADPNEARRLQYERLQLFAGDDEAPNTMMPHMTTSFKKSVAKHKKNMAKKVNEIMSKVQR
ncbi:hypothetical protein CTA2_1 [Colletotrichum tanaceti]|uniref:Uncharacterized protein n=1 Tax=Colletotrichum tanaceti TaxID=1306861 RepID=A0A4U6XTU1_9PEZI|nr:hypothetical protein CTA2_46 [Colletotrichum tanaceti]KAJ0169095.1 hypothetical protein CTA2_1 [Colletotrichum tanaceti]TKW59395.1 hypothetical protein CTA1_10219 [Colletotrichum tanaceti]